MRAIAALIGCLLLAAPAAARDLRIATWNMEAAWDGKIEANEDKLREAAAQIKADVYVLEEINSLTLVKRIAELLGVAGAQIAVSDFAKPVGTDITRSLENAVISTVPIVKATELEFDAGDRSGPLVNDAATATAREPLTVPAEVRQTLDESVLSGLHASRGALRVELSNGLVIYAVHAKSEFSNYCAALSDAAEKITEALKPAPSAPADTDTAGAVAALAQARSALAVLTKDEEETSFTREWIKNAQKREALFGALAEKAAADVRNHLTVAVMGDFNIPIDDPRSGKNLGEDCNPTRSCSRAVADRNCQGKDGLDDSHFLISGGLQRAHGENFAMRPLTKDLTVTLTGDFASAIDHIYVAGPQEDRFSMAETRHDAGGHGFSSDHLPVVTIFHQPD
jgi:endonuclease/exonuclease/phosphatase family metal-dependent hydrolase